MPQNEYMKKAKQNITITNPSMQRTPGAFVV
jgi:hypothetical protein